MHFGDVVGTKTKARQSFALIGEHAANAIRGGAVAARGHQFQRHIVEREQHALGAVAAGLPRWRAREQCLVGRRACPDVVDEDDDVIEPNDCGTSDHGKSPRVVLAARTFSTPIAIAAVRWEMLSVLARSSIVSNARSRM